MQFDIINFYLQYTTFNCSHMRFLPFNFCVHDIVSEMSQNKNKKTVLWFAAAASKLLQSCPTLCDPIDGSPPGSPVPGILQARTLEWVAISFSNAWKWKVKSFSRVWLLATPWTAAHQAPPSMGFSNGVGCHCVLHVICWLSPKIQCKAHVSKC